VVESRHAVPFSKAIFGADFERFGVVDCGGEGFNGREDGLNAAVERGGVDTGDGWREG